MNAVSWTEDTIYATVHDADDARGHALRRVAREPIGFWTDLDRVRFGRPVFEFYVSCRSCRERLGLSVRVPRPPETPNVLGVVAVREE